MRLLWKEGTIRGKEMQSDILMCSTSEQIRKKISCGKDWRADMSIKKIAEKAGVSPATVSRVLNNPNYRCSSEKIKDKIWKTAMEMNYVPNEAARNLKLGNRGNREKTYYISVLMTRMEDSQTDPFFSEVLRIMESEIHKQMCILSNVWYRPVLSDDRRCRNADLDQIIQGLDGEGNNYSDGLIIIGKCNQEALQKLNRKYKSVVSVNRNSTNYEVDEVLCDGHKVAALAVEHLVQLGHRNIGYVGDCNNEARYRGFLDVLHKYDLDLNPNHVIETRQTEAEGYAAMKTFMESGECPTGIYCANDITAIGMLKYLNRLKIKYHIPAIIASDDIEEAQNTKPMLTTVRLPKEEMGKFAIYLLLDRIRGGHKGVVRIEVEGKLMIRSSCISAEEYNCFDYRI